MYVPLRLGHHYCTPPVEDPTDDVRLTAPFCCLQLIPLFSIFVIAISLEIVEQQIASLVHYESSSFPI